jgi:protein-S-isoprenylcysteine O-methyltransferase Ste14
MLKGFPDLPPIWFAGAAFTSWLLARHVPIWTFPEGFGRAFILGGAGLIVWALVWFRRKRTPVEPNRAPRALIVEGPFRINRNPIYTGLALILIGWALALAAVSALIPALAFGPVITRRFVVKEEAALRAAFGDEAEVFFQRTRRW